MTPPPLRLHALTSCVLMLAFTFAVPALAAVKVQDAWVRGTVPGQDTTGAYMKLTSSADAALVGARSGVAKAVELHAMSMAGGMMKMRPVPKLALPAGRTVELGASGYHLMVVGVKQPLRAGEKVPITLSIEDASGKRSDLEVSATVRPLTASPDDGAEHAHDMPGHPH